MMRIVLIILAFVVFFSATPVSAQDFKPDDRYQGYPASLIRGGWPTAMPDLKACHDQEYYEPADFGLIKFIGQVKIAKIEPQKTDKCVYMLTRNRWRWVLRPKGTLVAYDERGRELFDMGLPGRRPCGNPRNFSFAVMEEIKPPESPVVREEVREPEIILPPPEPAPQASIPLVPIPAPSPTPITQTAPIPEPKVSQFGITASSLLTKFRSSPVNGLVSRLSDRDVCDVKGWAFDVGAAWGKPDGSFWRMTFSGKLVENDSFTQYFCPECDMQVTNKAKDMKIWGGKIERVQRVGFRNYAVRPMITVHGGIGGVTGRSIRLTRLSDGSVAIQRVGAREMFGSNAFPIAGFGAGVIGNVGKRLTLGATIVGIEYPGIYYGAAQLTYWP